MAQESRLSIVYAPDTRIELDAIWDYNEQEWLYELSNGLLHFYGARLLWSEFHVIPINVWLKFGRKSLSIKSGNRWFRPA